MTIPIVPERQSGLKKAVVLCLLRNKDALLLLHRSKEPNRGKYIPVGGHIEPFETPRQAAVREVREEAGYTVHDLQFRGVLVETAPRDYNYVIFIYSAETDRFPPPDCREGRLEWVEWTDVPRMPTPTTDMYIYRLIAAGQTFMLNAEYDESLELRILQDEITGEVLYSTVGGAQC